LDQLTAAHSTEEDPELMKRPKYLVNVADLKEGLMTDRMPIWVYSVDFALERSEQLVGESFGGSPIFKMLREVSF
jgi:hypothetical protein